MNIFYHMAVNNRVIALEMAVLGVCHSSKDARDWMQLRSNGSPQCVETINSSDGETLIDDK